MEDSQLKHIQNCLQEENVDGWLLYDFQKSNEIAWQVLSFPEDMFITRKWFYWIPKQGDSIGIFPEIDHHSFEICKGNHYFYRSRQQLDDFLQKVLHSVKTVAMEYSPYCAIPYIAKVDAGTIDKIRSFGMLVVSSSDLVQRVLCALSDQQIQSHFQVSQILQEIASETWIYIFNSIKAEKRITEFDVVSFIQRKLQIKNCITEGSPICAAGVNGAYPHYMPTKEKSKTLEKGDLLYLDLWGKLNHNDAIFADYTQAGVLAEKPNDLQKKLFSIVAEARDKAIELVRSRLNNHKEIKGYEIDRAARDLIEQQGYGEYFIHRTGHNIHTHLHGPGMQADDFESHDERKVLSRSCFSIEPGIYLPSQEGIRLECNCLIDAEGKMHLTGLLQDKLITME